MLGWITLYIYFEQNKQSFLICKYFILNFTNVSNFSSLHGNYTVMHLTLETITKKQP